MDSSQERSLRDTATARVAPSAPTIRPAEIADIDRLLELEQRCFDQDRLSRRSFRHLLSKAHADCVVAEGEAGALAGYALVLYSRGTALARLYSLAVEPEQRRRGIAARLLSAAEEAALAGGAVELRLEVRADNAAAIAAYERGGYRRFGSYQDYYEDHSDALRMAKRLVGGKPRKGPSVPFHAQTLPFTCGPASLMMAMRALDAGQPLDRRTELRLWREATLIYMTSGHGGCEPFGLALAAARRGFPVELYASDEQRLFVDSVRDPKKKEVIRLVLKDFHAEARRLKLPIHRRGLLANEACAALSEGAIPVVLISSYALTGEKAPHWVVLTGFDERFVYFHDPDADERSKAEQPPRLAVDCMNVPVPRAAFDRMARYGATRLKAAVVVRPKSPTR